MDDNKQGTELLDLEETGRRSLFECLTPSIQDWTQKIPLDIWQTDFQDLEKELDPSPTLRVMRRNLWKRYKEALEQGGDIRAYDIYHGVVTRQSFWTEILGKPKKLAYILSPKAEYDEVAAEALDFGMERIRKDILTAPIINPATGKFDASVAGCVLAAVRLLDSRVKGSPLQRIEQKTMQVNIHRNEKTPITREQLDEELRMLQARLGSTPMTLPSSPTLEDDDGQS